MGLIVISEKEQEFLELTSKLADGINKRIFANTPQSKVIEAGTNLHRRMLLSCNSLITLVKNSEHDMRLDGASILRTLYDAMLQGLYILQNPANRQERAELFLNFSVVEQVESIRRMDANPSKMAIWLRNSPNRASVEPMLMANFKKVEGNYKTKKDGIRKNWYPRTLKEIAVEVGLNEEYDVFQSWLSGAVHSSPLTLRNGFQWSGESMITTAILFSFRILGEMANAAGIQLTGTERDMMGLAHKSFVDFETPPTPAPEP